MIRTMLISHQVVMPVTHSTEEEEEWILPALPVTFSLSLI